MDIQSILIISILIGIIPAAIAHSKGSSFLGWWIFGAALFIVALPLAIVMKPDQQVLEQHQLSNGDMKKCPYCAELIKREAIVCRYCGKELSTVSTTDLVRNAGTDSQGEIELMKSGYVTVTNKRVKVKSESCSYSDISEIVVGQSSDVAWVNIMTKNDDYWRFGYSGDKYTVNQLAAAITEAHEAYLAKLNATGEAPKGD